MLSFKSVLSGGSQLQQASGSQQHVVSRRPVRGLKNRATKLTGGRPILCWLNASIQAVEAARPVGGYQEPGTEVCSSWQICCVAVALLLFPVDRIPPFSQAICKWMDSQCKDVLDVQLRPAWLPQKLIELMMDKQQHSVQEFFTGLHADRSAAQSPGTS